MNKIALTVAFLILFSGISHAISKNDATKVINKLKADNTSLSSPLVSEENVAQAFKTPPGKDYDASKDRCIEARDFKITNLAMKLQYEFVKKKWFWELDQWDCQFHVVKIDYELTCLNNLTYNGTHYIASESSLIELNREGWTRGRRMAREAYGFKENLPISEYINANGTITRDAELGEWRHYTIAKIDTASIFKKWENQKVSVPDYEYAGAPGILPRPVLLIHGLGKTYEDWGVEAYSEGSPEFKAGKVKKYKNGSLPDMLARSNNLNTDTDAINSNGIYFLQIDYDIESVESIFSNVIAFYEKIEFVMNDYYRDKLGIDWRKSDIYKIDLVTHSLGGLVVRAMLGVMQARIPFLKTGLENPLNHINRLVTVNTPHFGSQLAADASRMPPGLELIVKDIENPTDHTLVSAKVNLFLEKLGLAVYSIMLGYENVAHLILGSEFHLRLKGPYIGVYKPELFVKLYDLIEGAPTKLDSITTLKDFANMMKVTREFGIFLDKDSRFIDSLSNFSQDIKTGIFPLRPDGTPITLLPMYSDSAHKALPELFRLAGEEADYLCSRGEKDPNCFAVGAFLKSYVKENFNVRLTGEKFDKNFYNALLDIQNDWLKHSDGLVEVNSQKFYNPDRNDNLIDNPNLKGYFLPPRPYAIHNAISPYEAVLHGPVTPFRNEGATRQGLDLLCALSSACDAAFEKAVAEGRGAVLLLSETLVKGEFSERVLDVTGDFNLAPSYISEGIQGLSISSNGETILTAEYEPEKGSTITLKSSAPMQPASQGVMPLVMAMSPMSASAEQFELVVGPEIATQPSISRKGDSVIVSFVNYSGRAFKKAFLLPELPSNLTVSVLAKAGAAMSPTIIGSAVAANPETQKPRIPPGHRLAPVTLSVYHREARGQHESNTSRPRFLIHNETNDTLEFSKVAYYFTADPARFPKVVIDYPHIPVSLENLGGDQWRFILDAGNQKVAPKSFYPSIDGWQIRVHYSDWYEYEHFDDWSADYSIGIPKQNSKIVVYDKNGKIIWGNEAPGFESEDEGIIPIPKGTIAWKDDAPWETNAFKPRVTVKNTGSVALSDYHAQLWFRVPQGKNLHIPAPNIWYTPESQASAKNVGGRVWMLDMHFNKHILYPNDSVSEGNIGLNLTDWSTFDKTVCGIVLKDKDGNILFGREPGVVECEGYSGPGLLQMLFSRRKK